MRICRVALVAWTVPATCVALLAAGAALAIESNAEQLANAEYLANVSLSVGFATVGALIVSRRPHNRLGLLYLGVGFASAMTVFAFAYAWYGLVHRPDSLTGAVAMGWVSAWVWVLGFSPAATFGLLLFPDGRLPSRRWRWVAVVPALGILAMGLGGAFRSGPLVNHPVVLNPLGVPGSQPTLTAVSAVGFPLVLVGLVGGIASLVARWRRAGRASVERRQITLLALAGVATLSLAAQPAVPTNPVTIAVGQLVMAAIPAAVGVAILRHRLYDIEVALNRSLVYGSLTGLILLVYVVAVTLASRAAGSGPVLPGLAAAGAALALLPLRGRLQRGVDRLMYGDGGDPYRAIASLADRLSAVAAPGEALQAVVDNVRSLLRVPFVAVDVDGHTVAASGVRPVGDAVREVLTHQGVQLGELVVAAEGGRLLDTRRRFLLAGLIRQAAPAVHAARLTDDVQRSRHEVIAAREEERRRIRRDLHDGLGPTLAGVALGIDVAVAKLDLAPDDARAILKDLKDEANSAVADVRRIAYGLRPPALDEFGLIGALQRAADHAGRGAPAVEVTVAAPVLPTLDAATEVAAYRIAVEAMSNAVKHSGGSHVHVRVTRAAQGLVVDVRDDGTGMTTDVPPGVGMTAMRERVAELGGCLELTSTASGTTVRARLPVAGP